jgi:hypothetical protein
VRELLKKTFLRLLPGPAEALQRHWRRRYIRRFERRHGLPAIEAKVVAHHGTTVLSGPFAGMKYIARATGSVLTPKLIGSYEAELAPFWECVFAVDYRSIVDIGSAEGYYVVGLARRFPGARVYGFDLDPLAQRLCTEMIRLNGVGETASIHGKADFETLDRVLTGRSLVLCDCDGCETFLLDPGRAPSLRTADILVEVHDFLDDSITPTLRTRFEPTHTIEYQPSVLKDPADYPSVGFLSADEQVKAVCEYRPQQGWLLMTARSQG